MHFLSSAIIKHLLYTRFQFFFFLFPLISNFPVLAFPCLSSCPWQSRDSSVVVDFIGWQLELGSTFAKETKFWKFTFLCNFLEEFEQDRCDGSVKIFYFFLVEFWKVLTELCWSLTTASLTLSLTLARHTTLPLPIVQANPHPESPLSLHRKHAIHLLISSTSITAAVILCLFPNFLPKLITFSPDSILGSCCCIIQYLLW